MMAASWVAMCVLAVSLVSVMASPTGSEATVVPGPPESVAAPEQAVDILSVAIVVLGSIAVGSVVYQVRRREQASQVGSQ